MQPTAFPIQTALNFFKHAATRQTCEMVLKKTTTCKQLVWKYFSEFNPHYLNFHNSCEIIHIFHNLYSLSYQIIHFWRPKRKRKKDHVVPCTLSLQHADTRAQAGWLISHQANTLETSCKHSCWLFSPSHEVDETASCFPVEQIRKHFEGLDLSPLTFTLVYYCLIITTTHYYHLLPV